MREEEKSKIRYSVIISLIGIAISLICLILELVLIKRFSVFWTIILICNILILLGNYYEYKKM
ncbi:MAG: hypothetical protein IJ105_05025 [Bacilli bacterium]|nr:hypothetical protein [Bacilli bacterium]